MVYRLIIVLGLLASAVWGQGTNTVYAQLVVNSQQADIQVSIAAKYNIGQPYHLATATLADAPGHTCNFVQPNPNNGGPFLDILGGVTTATSLNFITNFTRAINPNTGSPTNRYRIIASAGGAFPLLGVRFLGYDNVNCTVSLFYSGSLTAIDIKKYTTFGTLADELRTFPVNTSTIGANTLISGTPNGRTSVYALILYNSTAQTISITDLRTDATSAGIMILNNWCAGCSLILPNTNFPLFTTSLGGSVVLNLGAATPVSGLIMFRVE